MCFRMRHMRASQKRYKLLQLLHLPKEYGECIPTSYVATLDTKRRQQQASKNKKK